MEQLRSGLYECQVMHQRLSPKKHRFVYDVFMFALDLDELDELSRRLWFFSHNRFNLYSFRDKDHMERDGRTAKEQILDYLSRYGIDLKGGRVGNGERVFGHAPFAGHRRRRHDPPVIKTHADITVRRDDVTAFVH